MAKKRRKKSVGRGLFGTSLLLGGGAIGIAALPNTAATAGIKTNILSGFERGASFAPAIGGIAGVAVTADMTGKVVDATKSLGGKKRKKKRKSKEFILG